MNRILKGVIMTKSVNKILKCKICKRTRKIVARGKCRSCYQKPYTRRQRAERPWVNRNSGNRCRLKLRQEMLDNLGRICCCCGEDREVLLQMDHILGRKKHIEGGVRAYSEAKYDGWDKLKYQVLCLACNFTKYFKLPCRHALKNFS